MRPPALWMLLALGTSSPAAAALTDCAPQACPARESLSAMGNSPSVSYGAYYENSRSGADMSPEAQGDAGRRRVPTLTAPMPGAPGAAADTPPPEPEKKPGGVMGFLDRHKWSIGGAIAGAALSFFLGGWIGILAGLAVSLAVSYLGPKLFGKHDEES